MKEAAVATVDVPLIGSGSEEEATRRVDALLELGTARGYLTYEELNEKLPDEVVSPDRLDSLLMTIDEMGIKLIDDADVGQYDAKIVVEVKRETAIQKDAIGAKPMPAKAAADLVNKILGEERRHLHQNGDHEGLDAEELEALEKELAEASTKRIDDPVRMYLTQMGEIPLLTREQEISLAKKIEITRKIFRSKVMESDYCLSAAADILQSVSSGELPFDRTMKVSTAEDQADKATIGKRIPVNLATVRAMLARNHADWEALRTARGQATAGRAGDGASAATPPGGQAAGGAVAADQPRQPPDEEAQQHQLQDDRAGAADRAVGEARRPRRGPGGVPAGAVRPRRFGAGGGPTRCTSGSRRSARFSTATRTPSASCRAATCAWS